MTDRRILDPEAARLLHRERLDAEELLWDLLRERSLGTLRFRRLDPVAGLIPSFTCRERRLAIDVTDRNPVGNIEMADRATKFREAGWWLMRVRGVDVIASPQSVCDAVRDLCKLEDAVPVLRLVKGREEL